MGSIIAAGPTPADPNQAAYNQFGGGLGQYFGRLLGQNMAERRLANQLNPMRQAMLDQLQVSPIEEPTTEQTAALTAMKDPRAFARLAGSQEGALKVGALVNNPKTIKEVVVHPGDELNDRLGLNLQGDESAIVKLNYHRAFGTDGSIHENLQPGFEISGYKAPTDRSASSGVADIITINKAREADYKSYIDKGGDPAAYTGKRAMSGVETENYLRNKQLTSKETQAYKEARDQFVAAGGDEKAFPKFEQWSPQFTATQAISTAAGPAVVGRIKELETTATAARDQRMTIADGVKLLNTGKVFTGTGAQQRSEIARLMDTLIGRQTDEKAVSADTDTYLANSGRLVAKNMHAFGSGSGLTDKDLEFVNSMSGGKVEMNEAALRKLLKIVDKHAKFEIDNYNVRLKGLTSNPDYAVLGGLYPQYESAPEIDTEPPVAAPTAAPTAAPQAPEYQYDAQGKRIR